LLAVLPLAAQEASETITVQVVEVEAVVIDATGAPVEGLRSEDLEVRVNGKPAEITNFYRIHRGVAQDDVPQDQVRAPGIPAAQPLPSRLIVFIDDLHLQPGSKKRALDALQSYVRTEMPKTTRPIIVRWNGSRSSFRESKSAETMLAEIEQMKREPVRSVHATADRIRVLRQIDDVIDNPSKYPEALAQMALYTAVQYEKDRHRDATVMLEALEELVTLAAGFPERKVVLFVSDGVPLHAGTETVEYARDVLKVFRLRGGNMPGEKALDDLQYDLTPAFRRLAERAQASKVILSVLDPGGLRGFEQGSIQRAGGHAQLDSTAIRDNESDGMRMVAFQTGGRYVGNENDLHRAIGLLVGDASTYYSLGVRAPDADRFDISVRVRGRRDVRVLTARRRELSSPEELLAAALRSRLHSRAEDNPLGATLKVLPPTRDGARCVVPAQVSIPAERLARMAGSVGRVDVEMHAMAVDDRQNETAVRSSRKQLSLEAGQPFLDTLVFGFRAPRYVVSLAIVDGVTGATSYLQAEVVSTSCP
jgi:VWFA-related protein